MKTVYSKRHILTDALGLHTNPEGGYLHIDRGGPSASCQRPNSPPHAVTVTGKGRLTEKLISRPMQSIYVVSGVTLTGLAGLHSLPGVCKCNSTWLPWVLPCLGRNFHKKWLNIWKVNAVRYTLGLSLSLHNHMKIS